MVDFGERIVAEGEFELPLQGYAIQRITFAGFNAPFGWSNLEYYAETKQFLLRLTADLVYGGGNEAKTTEQMKERFVKNGWTLIKERCQP